MKLTKYIKTTYIEAIDPDSLEDAFEVAQDSLDNDFKSIEDYFNKLNKRT